jgi:hypothetical protein
MARLTWGAAGERFFNLGVDRGVLYVGIDPGVAWPGLISVSESPTGGDPKPFYMDGQKYLNLSSAEEFAATITAFSRPLEFGPCDGTVPIQNGLFITQQPRKSFGFSYRTMIGNDVDGPDHAYKIHLVYNALAAPAEYNYTTVTDTPDPIQLSWGITTMPPPITGFRPTAHFVVESRYTDPGVLSDLEDILYGNEVSAASLPTVAELIALFA